MICEEWNPKSETCNMGRYCSSKGVRCYPKYLVLKVQKQIDLIKLQNEIHELIHGDNSIGISVKWLDLADILLKVEIKEKETEEHDCTCTDKQPL